MKPFKVEDNKYFFSVTGTVKKFLLELDKTVKKVRVYSHFNLMPDGVQCGGRKILDLYFPVRYNTSPNMFIVNNSVVDFLGTDFHFQTGTIDGKSVTVPMYGWGGTHIEVANEMTMLNNRLYIVFNIDTDFSVKVNGGNNYLQQDGKLYIPYVYTTKNMETWLDIVINNQHHYFFILDTQYFPPSDGTGQANLMVEVLEYGGDLSEKYYSNKKEKELNMIRTHEELIADAKLVIGDRTDEESLMLLENISDTFNNAGENWEEKYNELAQKYKDRFSGEVKEVKEEEEEEEEKEEKEKIEDLFEEKGEK